MSYLKTYIAEGEHETQDFKMRIDDCQKIARSLVAFANTRGGRLLIGVKDNGSVCGVRPEEELHMIVRSAEEFCQPPVHFQHTLWRIEGKTVLEIWVEDSVFKPHLAKTEEGWKAFVRNNDVTIPASAVWVMKEALIKEREAEPESLFMFTSKEEELFSLLKSGRYTLNQLSRKTGAPRPILIRKLAKLMKWNVIKEHFEDGKALYVMNPNN